MKSHSSLKIRINYFKKGKERNKLSRRLAIHYYYYCYYYYLCDHLDLLLTMVELDAKQVWKPCYVMEFYFVVLQSLYSPMHKGRRKE